MKTLLAATQNGNDYIDDSFIVFKNGEAVLSADEKTNYNTKKQSAHVKTKQKKSRSPFSGFIYLVAIESH